MSEIWIGLMKDIIIGLISGGISSWIVTAIWQKRVNKKEKEHQLEIKKREYISSYYDTVQVLCRYLGMLRLELDNPDNSEKSFNIRRILESQPITPIFKYALTKTGKEKMAELSELKNNLDNDAQNGPLSESNRIKYKGKIFQFECNFLKNQSNYLETYENYVANKLI